MRCLTHDCNFQRASALPVIFEGEVVHAEAFFSVVRVRRRGAVDDNQRRRSLLRVPTPPPGGR